LIATSEGSARASAMTGAIGRAHGRWLVQLHVGGADVDVRHRLVSETADANRLRGTEPVIEIRTGAAHHAITELARRRAPRCSFSAVAASAASGRCAASASASLTKRRAPSWSSAVATEITM